MTPDRVDVPAFGKRRPRPVTVLKWILFAAVLAYVCRYGYRLWNQGEVRETPLGAQSIGWLILSGVVYLLGWLPSIWFWRVLMRAMGGVVSFKDAARAYYCGHLGKYIPGKAMVLVIRAAMVKDRGCRATTAAIAAVDETLTMMGTGIAVGAGVAPLLFEKWFRSNAPEWNVPLWGSVLSSIVVIVLVAATLPFVSRAMTWIAARSMPGGSDGIAGPRLPARMIGAGCAAFLLSWTLQGLSLGITLHAVAGTPLDLNRLPLWTGAMALSTALGFAVLFAPGGLGVREGILLAILSVQPGLTAKAAVAATVISRVVSFLSEVAVSAGLYLLARPIPTVPSTQERQS